MPRPDPADVSRVDVDGRSIHAANPLHSWARASGKVSGYGVTMDFGGASVSGSADEVKLEELRAIATQRMAKQRMYEEYVKARPAAAGGGARTSVFGDENETATTSDAAASSSSGSPLARFLKLVFFPLLLPFAIVKFALRLIRNLLGGGKAAGAQ